MLYRLICLFMLIIVAQYAFAQGNGKIVGEVSDSLTKQSLPTATVVLVKQGATDVVKSALTDADGKFTFTQVEMGKYQIKVTFVGFATKTATVELTAAKREATKIKIPLVAEASQLQEAVVLSEKPVIRNVAGKIIFDVAKTVTDGAETAQESLQKVPGVNVQQDGSVTVRGKSGVRILVDGKSNPMAQTNPEQFLKSIPAKNIESIEVNTSPSAKYDASGSGVVINIKLKKGKLEGLNGSVAAGLGTVFNKFNGSGNLNYKKDKINVFVNASYNDEKKWLETNNDTKTILGDSSIYRNVHRVGNSHTQSGSGKVGIEYAIDSLHALTYTLDASDWAWKQSRSGTGYTRNNDGRIINTTLLGTAGNNADISYTNAINYRQTWDTTEKAWTIDMAHTYGKESSQANTFARTFDSLGVEVPSQYFNKRNVNAGTAHNILAQSDFVLAFKKIKDAKLEVGVKEEINIFNNNTDVYDAETGLDVRDTVQSSHFKYMESVTAAYGTYTGKHKSFTYSGGLRWEHTYTSSVTNNFRQSYSSFFPNVTLGYNITESHILTLNYGRNIDRPGFWMLNNNITYINQYTVSSGNPNIKPTYINSVSLNYNANIKQQSLTFSASFSRADATMQQISRIDSNKITYTRFENAGYQMSTYVGVDGSFKVTKWFDLTLSPGVEHSWFGYVYNNQGLQTQRNSFNLWGTATFRFWKNASLQMSGWFNSGYGSAQTMGSPTGGVSASIKKKFFHEHVIVSISCRDIFNTNTWRNHTVNPNIDSRDYWKSESRVGYVTLTYQFGKQSFQQDKTKGKSGRMGSGGGGGQ